MSCLATHRPLRNLNSQSKEDVVCSVERRMKRGTRETTRSLNSAEGLHTSGLVSLQTTEAPS